MSEEVEVTVYLKVTLKKIRGPLPTPADLAAMAENSLAYFCPSSLYEDISVEPINNMGFTQ
jgi:hypothetical protein